MRKNLFTRGVVAALCLAMMVVSVPGTKAFSDNRDEKDIVITETAATNGTASWTVAGTNANLSILGTLQTTSGRYASTAALTIENPHGEQATVYYKYSINGNVALSEDDGGSTSALVTINGVTIFDSGIVPGAFEETGTGESFTLENGGTFQIEIQAAQDAESNISVSITELQIVSSSGKSVTFLKPTNGSYTVSGTNIGEDTAFQDLDFSAGVSVTVTPVSNYIFIGWRDGDTGKMISTSSTSLAAIPDSTTKLVPSFIPKQDPVFQAAGVNYYNWEDAFTMAPSTSPVVLVKNNYSLPTTLPDNGFTGTAVYDYMTVSENKITGYTIPASKQFLLPYAAGATTITDSEQTIPYANYQIEMVKRTVNQQATAVTDHKYLSMTVPSSITIRNKGVFAVGGTFSGQQGLAGISYGAHSNLQLDGTLKLTDGGVFSAVGYVIGSGEVIAEAGKVYVPFTVNDFRGGGYTVGAAGAALAIDTQSGEDYISPFFRYTANTIQTDLIVSSGSSVSAYCNLYANDKFNSSTGLLIGDGGLITPAAGTTVTVTYEADVKVAAYPGVGRTNIFVNGSASFGSLKLTVELTDGMAYDVHTSDLNFPIPYNFAIYLDNGTFSVSYAMSLMPGAKLVVGENASLTLSKGNADRAMRFAIYDGLYDHTSYGLGLAAGFNTGVESLNVTYGSHAYAANGTTGTGENYPKTEDLQKAGYSGSAQFIVNGSLEVLANVNFGGIVQTENQAGASVRIDGNATNEVTTQVGQIGTYTVGAGLGGVSLGKPYVFSGATVRTLKAKLYDNLTGNVIDIQKNITYQSRDSSTNSVGSYSYTLYSKFKRDWRGRVTLTQNAYTENATSTGKFANVNAVGRWYNHAIPVKAKYNGVFYDAGNAYAIDGVSLAGTRYYTNEAMTAQGTVSASTAVLYTNAVAVVYDASNNIVTACDTLRNAVAACPATGYIRMVDNTKENGYTIEKAITLDLNKFKVEVAGTDGVITGFDSGTNGYASVPGTNLGSINITDEDMIAAPRKINGKYYLPITDSNGTTFHRVAVAVTSCQFLYRSSTDESTIVLEGTFKGTDQSAAKLTDLGFRFTDDGNVWANNQFEIRYDTVNNGTSWPFYYGREFNNPSANITALAMMEFDGTELLSNATSNLTALHTQFMSMIENG